MAKSPKKRRRYPWILGVVLAVGIVAVIFGPELMPTEWVRRLTKSFISDSLRQALHEKVYVSLDEVEWRRWNRLQLRNLAIIRTEWRLGGDGDWHETQSIIAERIVRLAATNTNGTVA